MGEVGIISIGMTYSYILYVSLFGALVVCFLWLRDARIFWKTGLPGYRNAAYRGVFYTAIAFAGAGVGLVWEFVSLIIILIALYLQGKVKKERNLIWTRDSSIADRLTGNTSYRPPGAQGKKGT